MPNVAPAMKTLWIMNHYAQEPGGTIGRTGHYALAKYLREYGWNTLIIASSVEHNSGRQRLRKQESFRLDTYDGVRFLWLRTPQYVGNGARRVLNMLSYAVRAFCHRYSNQSVRPDLIIGTTLHPLAAFVAAKLAERYKVPFIFEVRDLWPQTLIDMGRISADGIQASLLRRLEKWLCLRASRIITVLPKASEYLKSFGVKAENIIWLPNGVDLRDFPSPPPPKEKDTFDLMYFGAHGTANGLENLLRAMEILERRVHAKPVRLRLIGDGPLKEHLIKLARTLGLKSVVFEPPVPRSLIPSVAMDADAFVFNLIDLPVFRFGISSNKLFDYMAGARPILFCSNAANNPIQEADAGVTVQPDEPKELAHAIERLLDRPRDERRRMGQNARRYVEQHYDYASMAQKLSVLLNEVVQSA